ncbi:ABC transporter ATP-binding protein [Noviherbaspirillum sp. 1P10PC]|uniref:ATP-binding cassette domain-containing protein n=1 Tax=Noviherbaspirillum sp. 1P10PC TaxID=3132292 RepID=UPI00399F4988
MSLNWQRWLTVFSHPSALLTIALITIHQSIIASSSYFLTRLIELFQQGGEYSHYLYLYLAAMLIPYLPGCLSFISLQRWINQAHKSLIYGIAQTAYGRTEKFRNSIVREQVESIVSRNSFITIKEYLSFVHGFLGFVLNSALSMLVLGLLLPGNLFGGYFLSVILCAAFILLVNKAISTYSAENESRFISYSDSLSSIWDNTTLGNKLNYNNWAFQSQDLGENYYKGSNDLQSLKQCGNLILAAAALGPTIYLVLSAVENNVAQPALVAAIIVNLTRVFHILNSLSSLVSQLLEWPSMNARLEVMFRAENILLSEDDLPAKPLSKITLNAQPINDYKSVVEALKHVQRGRFTIRGGNGSGKSTLLLVLKKFFGEPAIMLPAHHGRLIWRDGNPNHSTGQRTLQQIREIVSGNDVRVLLFDEWDANLDHYNREAVNQLLDEIASKLVVIEIRH